MTPEEKNILKETYRLSLENAELLKEMRKSQKAAMVIRVSYWLILLAMSLGAYYLVQPYVDTVRTSFQDIVGLI